MMHITKAVALLRTLQARGDLAGLEGHLQAIIDELSRRGRAGDLSPAESVAFGLAAGAVERCLQDWRAASTQ